MKKTVLLSALLAAAGALAAPQPNILLILSDDADFSMHGSTQMQNPVNIF